MKEERNIFGETRKRQKGRRGREKRARGKTARTNEGTKVLMRAMAAQL